MKRYTITTRENISEITIPDGVVSVNKSDYDVDSDGYMRIPKSTFTRMQKSTIALNALLSECNSKGHRSFRNFCLDNKTATDFTVKNLIEYILTSYGIESDSEYKEKTEKELNDLSEECIKLSKENFELNQKIDKVLADNTKVIDIKTFNNMISFARMMVNEYGKY